MKILFLTSRLPYPANRGDRVRTFNFLKRLSVDHDIQLLSFIESEEEKAHLPALEPYCRVETVLLSRSRSYVNMGTRIFSPKPFQTSYYHSPEMAWCVRNHFRRHSYDLVYVHLFRMVPFAPFSSQVSQVLDLTDCMSKELEASISYRRWLLRLPLRWEAAKIKRYEAQVAGMFDEVWTISEADRVEILKLAPRAHVRVVPNGVDQRLYEARPERHGHRLGFLGNLSVPHNVDAARFLALEIMPRVRDAYPQAQLELVGACPCRAVEQLEGRNGTLVSGPRENLRQFLESISVFVSPLRFAAGIQNKILEAMAAGVPVVTTPLGNQGLAAEAEKEILVRERSEDFASAVVSLLRSPERGAEIGERGRTFVRNTFSWDAVAERIYSVTSRSSPPRELTSV